MCVCESDHDETVFHSAKRHRRYRIGSLSNKRSNPKIRLYRMIPKKKQPTPKTMHNAHQSNSAHAHPQTPKSEPRRVVRRNKLQKLASCNGESRRSSGEIPCRFADWQIGVRVLSLLPKIKSILR